MKDLAGARVLVTGGASGIGRCIAEACAARQAIVVVGDRHAEAAEDVAAGIRERGGQATAVAMDVTSPAQVAAARDAIHARIGPIDVLVNNAGTVHGGAFLSVPLDDHLGTYRVNVEGLVAVTHTFLPDLTASPQAHVVNIASAAGFVGLPFGTTYASSKWAVVGFSESLRLELKECGFGHVGVTTVCPSFVTTGLFDGVRPPLLTPALTAERVAALTLRGMLKGRAFVLTPWMVRLTPRLRGLLPLRLFDRVAGVFGVNTSMASWRGRHGGG
jgi:short-subunit dehydrogenase